MHFIYNSYATVCNKVLKEHRPLFKIEFDLMVNSELTATWHNVFHITKDKNCCGNGRRIPAVWLNKNKSVYISSSVNGKGNHYKNIPYQLNQLYHYEITQEENLNGEIVYSIKVDGSTVHEIVNEAPMTFPLVKLYLSDPWHKSIDPYGTLSNFKIMAPEGMSILIF